MTKNKGRTFIGTLFLLGIGFAVGMFHKEIVSYTKNTVQSISH
jgi:hypothetical protein